jgi:hypothetical protein
VVDSFMLFSIKIILLKEKNIIESVVLDDVYDVVVVAVVQAVDSASGCEVADNSADSSKTKEPSDLKSAKQKTFKIDCKTFNFNLLKMMKPYFRSKLNTMSK